ncbi:MAG: PP2C family protein-serine/threonine phosphatase, partial [Candidatus Riflebacteria bacterium]
SSALVMAMAKAIVYQGLKEQRPLVELFADLNLTIHTYFKIPPARKMITLFAAILHCESGEICCANAGHNFPVKVSGAGEIEEFSSVHLPIGAMKKLRNLNLKYYQIAPCDTAVFYTDGLIEVKNKADEMYGYDQFKENLKTMANASAQEILAGLVQCYDQWLGEAEPDDDLTIIVLKRDQIIV